MKNRLQFKRKKNIHSRESRIFSSICVINALSLMGFNRSRTRTLSLSLSDGLSVRILYKHVPPGLGQSRPMPFSTGAAHVVS